MMDLRHGDCLELMQSIPTGSIDSIICDLPYGTTACSWDNVIPFEPLWEQYNRIIKSNGAIVLFGSEPFSSKLVVSNLEFYKYTLIWKKNKMPGFAQAPYRFLTEHENINIFSKGGTAKNANIRMKFNPQGLIYKPKTVNGKKANASAHRIRKTDQKQYVSEYTNYPKTILKFDSVNKTVHPTQKPVALLEYLVKTYTNENELVLDNTMGSGSTGIACQNTNRNFIGIELDENYYNIAKKRIEENGNILKLF